MVLAGPWSVPIRAFNSASFSATSRCPGRLPSTAAAAAAREEVSGRFEKDDDEEGSRRTRITAAIESGLRGGVAHSAIFGPHLDHIGLEVRHKSVRCDCAA